jgi:hypothetical protein
VVRIVTTGELLPDYAASYPRRQHSSIRKRLGVANTAEDNEEHGRNGG